MESNPFRRVLRGIAAAGALVIFAGAGFRVLASCAGFGLPFTDLGATGFCAQIAEAYYTELTNGTSATTYAPGATVSREQMAAFVTRTLDRSVSRGNRRSQLQQFWNGVPRWEYGYGLTTTGDTPGFLQSDGTDVWVPHAGDGSVTRVRASDGNLIGVWTGAAKANALVVALGQIFVVGGTDPGSLYWFSAKSASPGTVLNVVNSLGPTPTGIAFDGTKIWTMNANGVSIVTPGAWSYTNVTTGFSAPFAGVFDGSNVWVTDAGDGTLKKLNASGGILQTVSVGSGPALPAFDGTNLWVPNRDSNSVTVVRASSGTVIRTLTGNGLSKPTSAAFDGQRILVTNQNGGLSLFHATTLASIAHPATAGMTTPFGACSDGVGFWISDMAGGGIGRF